MRCVKEKKKKRRKKLDTAFTFRETEETLAMAYEKGGIQERSFSVSKTISR